MGTTAEKLTYLGVTKEKIRNSINLTGANLTSEDTFRSYASKLKKGYIDIINNGIDTLYNNFPKVSGIGSNLSLTPTYEAPMKLNEIQGNTLQENTPTPNTPVPIQSVTGLQNVNVTGKNLLDLSKCINGYINSSGGVGESNYDLLSDYIKVESGKNYTISLNTQFYNIGYAFYDSSKTYILRYNTNRNLTTLTTTIPSGTSYIRVWFNYNGTTTLTPTNMLQYEPMIEQGSSSTSFEPYKGNTYEVNLGKNLVDFSNLQTNNNTTYTWQNDILEVKATTGTYNRVYIDITSLYKNNPGKTLRFDYETLDFSQGVSSSVNLQIVKSGTNTYVELVDNSGTIITRTIPNDTSEITQVLLRAVCNNTNTSQASQISITKPILHFGNIATTYAPYFTPIELNKIGTYQDSIKKSTGKNLFDKNAITDNKWLLANGNEEAKTSYCISDYIPVIAGEQYYLQNPSSRRLKYYDINKQALTTSDWDIASTENQVLTIPNNAYYVRITIYKTNVSIDTYQFEKGTTASPYEPYGKVWYVEKQIGKVVLNGSEGWSENGENTDYGQYALSINDKQYGNYLLSDKFVAHTGSTGNYIWGRSNNNNIYITIAKSIVSYGLATFKTWLSTHNTIVYYVLATPEITEITNTELIEDLETLYTAKSQEGTTNISITSEDLEMILNVSALKGEV